MRLIYPAKILLAWGEAISGNAQIRDWLIKNGYQELGIFTFALHLDKKSRKWLMDNGHPHLMALISGVEGDRAALAWLDRNDMGLIKQMALAGDGDVDAFNTILRGGHRELAMIAKKIHSIKAAIEEDNKDPHKYR